jgi:hypothetical protein
MPSTRDIIADTPGVIVRRVVAELAVLVLVAAAWPGTALACSPSFNPTIRELGPGQIVVVGRVGERVPSGRLFYVERWYNGGEPRTPIVIAFKEGEPVGDCSYPVATGERKIIAPFLQPDGTLYADLGTLQADPGTEDGKRYIAEAIALFGPGVVPEPPPEPPAADGPIPWLPVVAVAGAAAIVGVVIQRRRHQPVV